MNQIIYGAIFTEDRLLTKSVYLKNFSWLQHKPVEEFCLFVCREVLQRTPLGVFHSIRDTTHFLDIPLGVGERIVQRIQDYQVQVWTPEWSPLAIAFITDINYPSKYIRRLALYILEEFNTVYPEVPPDVVTFPFLKKKIYECQDPSKIDVMSQIEHDTEETRNIMVKSIEDLLQNGEKIEELVQKSDDLATTSKLFFKKSKKLNRWCCQIL